MSLGWQLFCRTLLVSNKPIQQNTMRFHFDCIATLESNIWNQKYRTFDSIQWSHAAWQCLYLILNVIEKLVIFYRTNHSRNKKKLLEHLWLLCRITDSSKNILWLTETKTKNNWMNWIKKWMEIVSFDTYFLSHFDVVIIRVIDIKLRHVWLQGSYDPSIYTR